MTRAVRQAVRLAPGRRLLAWLLLTLAAASSGAGEVEKERLRDPVPVAVSAGALRYEALHWGKALGLGQNGGFVMARDLATGRVLWIHRVYAIDDRDGKEGDKQDVFITALALEAGGRALRISTENRQLWRLDLRTFESRRIAR